MANSLITNQIIARESIRLWKNNNAFLMNTRNQYEDEFARAGAKIGYSIRIRLPVDYGIRIGPTAVAQNTVEQSVPMTVAQQAGVDMSFSMADRTMVVDKFMERYVRPAVNVTAGYVATQLMAGTEGGASGWSANYDPSTGALLPPILRTWTDAKAILTNNSIPTQERKIVMAPLTESSTISQFSTLYNSQPRVARQYETGDMTQALGFDWMADPTVIGHTTGSLSSGTPAYTAGKGFAFTTVAGAGQTGNSLAVAALTGTLKQGDIIVINNTYGNNRVTKATTGQLRHFTVTADCPIGSVAIPIYPSILGVDGSGNSQAYQTVMASPANGATVYSVTQQNVMYRKNLAFHPDAITLAIVDMEMPPNVDVAREVQDDVSIRVLTQYQGGSDQNLTRLDILFGSAFLKPEWIVVVPDPIL